MARKTNGTAALVCVCLLALILSGCAGAPPPTAALPLVPPERGQWLEAQAVWYGQMFHGRRTTSGEVFDMRAMTGAHASLPLGAAVEVVNPVNGRQVTVVINDRHQVGNGIDLALSQAAAQALGLSDQRQFPVRYRWLP